MASNQHPPSRTGKMWLVAGVVLGLLLIAVLLTKGFGLFAGSEGPATDNAALVKHGDSVQVPDGSPLRDRIQVAPASAESINAKLVLPGMVESDPARTAAILTPLSGRILELKVALG